jgi:hypothetical protein
MENIKIKMIVCHFLVAEKITEESNKESHSMTKEMINNLIYTNSFPVNWDIMNNLFESLIWKT